MQVSRFLAVLCAAVISQGVSAQAYPSGPVLTSTPEELGDYVKSEIQKWARLVRDAGIQPE